MPLTELNHTGTGFYRLNVGSFECVVISDGGFNFPPPAFGTNAPEGSVEQILTRNQLPTTHVAVQLHCLLVNTGQNLVLIDTGLGPNVFPGDHAVSGRLLATLAYLGINREEIDTVIFTHGHPDHVGGASSGGAPNFPHAQHYISQTDWDFWSVHPGNIDDPFLDFMLTVGQNNLQPLRNQIQLITQETEIVPGIRMINAPGHTMGHMGVLIASGDDRLLHIADTVVQYIVALENPDWHLAADMDPDLAVQTRRKLLSRASGEGIRVFGDHFPFPGIGHVIYNQARDNWHFLPTG
ncbi:MAG: MBL fold metallo-hydrolase [Chloroflexi bacterium]|nr:MAG: MBL fold metallo-hydrolase [Chloroflexota bacterium]